MRKLNVKGFSLVELMVVVAIIGILSAIAIPNFQRFQRKARQSEARTLLGGLYTAMETFKAEWEDYTPEFINIGFAPSGSLRYNVGIAGMSGPVVADPNFMSWGVQTTSATACNVEIMSCIDNSMGAALPAGTDYMNDVGLGGDTFTAGAGGNIGGTNNDEWTVDHTKTFLQGADGTL